MSSYNHDGKSKHDRKMEKLQKDLTTLTKKTQSIDTVVGDVVSSVANKQDAIESVDPEKNPFIQKSNICPCTIS